MMMMVEGRLAREVGSFLEFGEEVDKEGTSVYVGALLPDELVERILAYLPPLQAFSEQDVCVKDGMRLLPLKVCFMNNDSRSKLCMCNPITKKNYRKLDGPLGLKSRDYNALAMSMNKKSHNYKVAIVKSKQIPEDFVQWGISIHIYDSKNETRMTNSTEVLMGWRGGNESVICNGVLYFLVYSVMGVPSESCHALIAYDISHCSSQTTLRRSFIALPCSPTCGRLMNMNEKLVMVGEIGSGKRLFGCLTNTSMALGSLMMFLLAMVQMI
ncbi:F-box/kelch-repeat protein [Glycine soja]|nr:F-box/kelch-repeat protein [Glycine soja]